MEDKEGGENMSQPKEGQRPGQGQKPVLPSWLQNTEQPPVGIGGQPFQDSRRDVQREQLPPYLRNTVGNRPVKTSK